MVWTDWRDVNRDVYLYDIVANTEQILTSPLADQSHPSVSGNRVVWSDRRNGNEDIYLEELPIQRIAGVIRDDFGQPAADVQVALQLQPTRAARQLRPLVVLTDTQGRYAAEDIPPGTYHVRPVLTAAIRTQGIRGFLDPSALPLLRRYRVVTLTLNQEAVQVDFLAKR